MTTVAAIGVRANHGAGWLMTHHERENRMWIAVINNLPEMILGGAWTGLCIWTGYRAGKWAARRNNAA